MRRRSLSSQAASEPGPGGQRPATSSMRSSSSSIARSGTVPLLTALAVLTLSAGLATSTPNQNPPAPAQGRGTTPRPPRDSTQDTPPGTAAIGGRVLAADTGRPVKRARVSVSAGGRQSRAATTDDQGRFQLT